MCRHIAYVRPPVRVGDLLVAPDHGLLRQSWAPRTPRSGVTVASEPYDDSPLWTEVPDRSQLFATRTDVLVTPLSL
ncbi:hypothetical protein ACH492_00045 [Streptomyces sp. NPDC019443]|uniref:hypothetical protein n=1 Tax=Streptomyces sp. NPDC019443 TaxID=3365061 RepID=UPI0037B0998C